MATLQRHFRDWWLYDPSGVLVAVFRYRRGARHVAQLFGWAVVEGDAPVSACEACVMDEEASA